ncbi:RNA binding motif, single stranded interacting protein 3, partial [Chytridiales sp. JEL 0842]
MNAQTLPPYFQAAYHGQNYFNLCSTPLYAGCPEALTLGTTSENAFHMKNVYVRGLAKETTDADLFNLCKEFGTITSHKAIIDKVTKACKGYSFVMYQTIEESRVALDELRKLGYRVSFAKSGPRPRATKKAFNTFPNLNQPTPFQAPPEYSTTLPYEPLPFGYASFVDEMGIFMKALHTTPRSKMLLSTVQ